MSNFFDRLIGRKHSAASEAKDRLKFVLVTDRTSISPEDLRNMQREIIEVIKKYCRVSDDAVELKLEQRERENYLVADIPLTANQERGEVAASVRLYTGVERADDAEDDADEASYLEEPFFLEDEHSAETQELAPMEDLIKEMKVMDEDTAPSAQTVPMQPSKLPEELPDPEDTED